MNHKKPNSLAKQGFTLIEMLVVIGIIAILAAVVLVAVNPLRQFASARNAQRRADLHSLSNAIYQYAIDNDGQMPSGIPDAATGAQCVGTDAACVDLSGDLVPTYIADLPYDPSSGTAANTQYMVYQNNGRITASASGELGIGDIVVSR